MQVIAASDRADDGRSRWLLLPTEWTIKAIGNGQRLAAAEIKSMMASFDGVKMETEQLLLLHLQFFNPSPNHRKQISFDPVVVLVPVWE